MMAAKQLPPVLNIPPARKSRVRRKLTITLSTAVYAEVLAFADREEATTSGIVELAIVRYLRAQGVPVRSYLVEED